MSKEDFIKDKLSLMKKDNQNGFNDFVEPLQNMVDKNEASKTVQIPADGNWFNLSFNAVDVKQNRLVISAKRIRNGLETCSYDPSLKEYVVEFVGTRAAYIKGFYKHRHPIYEWPYIHWDIRSYATSSFDPSVRIYVQGFYAREEIRKMILALEGVYGSTNILNSYINDNLLRFQLGIRLNKTPQQIEKEWSQGLMESLGYHHVEAFDTGYPKGRWREVAAHWCKKNQDLRG